jgi:predicted house-cleaning noncanonical NTP pyrophosphatase (MazG superfamily)
MKKIYNKLVRDGIPEIIKKEGKNVSARILSDDEFVSELYKKIKEEAIELSEAEGDQAATMKEIGDIYEVIDALIDSLSLDREEINRIKNERKENRGAFKKKIFLESAEE